MCFCCFTFNYFNYEKKCYNVYMCQFIGLFLNRVKIFQLLIVVPVTLLATLLVVVIMGCSDNQQVSFQRGLLLCMVFHISSLQV